MSDRIDQFLRETSPQTPCLVVDLEIVAGNYRALAAALPGVTIYYAVKANPARPILVLLNRLGASFDAASIHEIRSCLAAGISPDRISFGNTVKKESAIAEAYHLGIRLFAFDCENELAKISRAAAGSNVFCRILTSGDGADWPLSDKFGCQDDMAAGILLQAREMDVNPVGISFHVGSQQRDTSQWDIAISKAAVLFEHCDQQGLALSLLNIGGGFPSSYREGDNLAASHCDAILSSITNRFPEAPGLKVIAEPGRYIAGDAGVIQSEVILVSKKSESSAARWVYLDIGRFGGLIETLDEAIKYRFKTSYDGTAEGPVVIAGPTCDEVDILYENSGYTLPLALKAGDKVEIMSTGAYTASYSAVGFNGFPPLKEYYI